MASSFGGKPGNSSGKGSVPPEELSAYERWVLPNMDVDHSRDEKAIASPVERKSLRATEILSTPPVEETVTPLTAEDVEAIRQAAYDAGHQEGKDTGYKEGHQQGLKQGYDEGYKSGHDDVRAISLRLSQICRTLIEPIPHQDDKLEAVLKQLVTNICTQVVRRELVIDSKGIAEVVKEALDCMQPGSKRIRIHLNPLDIDTIEKELRAQNQWENQWRLLAHKTITPGGCIIDTDDSIVDARAEKRLNALLQQIYSRDAQALQQEAVPKDSLAQVLSEIPAFVDAGTDITSPAADDNNNEESRADSRQALKAESSETTRQTDRKTANQDRTDAGKSDAGKSAAESAGDSAAEPGGN